MKVVILAGGFGTRLSEESHLRPKPMVEIGGMPILWHIMKTYSHYGFNEFIICCGYKGYMIKEYFADYYLHNSDVTFDFAHVGNMTVHNNFAEPWKVTLVDTGLKSMTGGRVKRIQPYVGEEAFMLTYGDGVGNIDVVKLLEQHKSHGKIGTMTTVNVGQRFGVLDIADDGEIKAFREKQKTDGSRINAGYMVMEPAIFDYIAGDSTVFEQEPLEKIATEGQLMGYAHEGFWKPMDTLREKNELEELWDSGKAPWKVWK